MFWTYILKTSNNSYYVGSTNNIQQRLKYHQYGKVSFTKNKLPVKLIYTEKFDSRSEAQKREYQIKRWKSRKAIERLFKR